MRAVDAPTLSEAARRLADPAIEYEIDLGGGWALPFVVESAEVYHGMSDVTSRASLARVFAPAGLPELTWKCRASGAPRRAT